MATEKREDPVLFALIVSLHHARKAEQLAKDSRIDLEESIVKHLAFNRESGSQSYDVKGEAVRAKINIKQPITRSVLADEVPAAKKSLGRSWFGKIFRTKHEVNARPFAKLKETDHDKFILASKAVSSKPGKVQVEITLLESGLANGD